MHTHGLFDEMSHKARVAGSSSAININSLNLEDAKIVPSRVQGHLNTLDQPRARPEHLELEQGPRVLTPANCRVLPAGVRMQPRLQRPRPVTISSFQAQGPQGPQCRPSRPALFPPCCPPAGLFSRSERFGHVAKQTWTLEDQRQTALMIVQGHCLSSSLLALGMIPSISRT